MNKAWRLMLLLVTVPYLQTRATDKNSADVRAFLYQRETRTVLESRGWHVSQDTSGKLVANHPLGFSGASFRPANVPIRAFAWLTLTFKPDTVIRTKCTANIVAYVLGEGTRSGKDLKPFPFNNSDTNKEIQDVMAKAEGNLAAKHAEYVGK